MGPGTATELRGACESGSAARVKLKRKPAAAQAVPQPRQKPLSAPASQAANEPGTERVGSWARTVAQRFAPCLCRAQQRQPEDRELFPEWRRLHDETARDEVCNGWERAEMTEGFHLEATRHRCCPRCIKTRVDLT